MKRITLTVTWIHVSDSLPQPGDVVMVARTGMNGKRSRVLARYEAGVFRGTRSPYIGVNFWMALPVLPEDVVLED